MGILTPGWAGEELPQLLLVLDTYWAFTGQLGDCLGWAVDRHSRGTLRAWQPVPAHGWLMESGRNGLCWAGRQLACGSFHSPEL
jgi:hypothetical protein